jgi:uncharacterized UPF0160 family protein
MAKIITHNGVFHADEVMAISLLKFFTESEVNQYEIVRTRSNSLIAEAMNDRFTYVIDVGGHYAPSSHIFDHHQDKNLHSSNVLVAQYLHDNGVIPTGFHDYLQPFMRAISDWDTNYENIHATYKSLHLKNYSQIIAGFNREPNNEALQMEQFNKAIGFTLDLLENLQYEWQMKVESENTYKNGRMLKYGVIVFEKYCTVWKEKGEFPFAIMPNPQGWSINSADSTVQPLAEDIEFARGCKFMHKGKFIAVFDTLENAEKAAMRYL